MKITWRELLADASGCEADLLSAWRWLVPPDMTLHLVSALGDAFLVDASGAVHWLDAGSAELARIADNADHFDTLRQQPEYANEWFVPQLVGDLIDSGLTLRAGQCFSYRTPPTLGGEVQPENFEACDISVHFHTLGQIQAKVHALPEGTPVRAVMLDDDPA